MKNLSIILGILFIAGCEADVTVDEEDDANGTDTVIIQEEEAAEDDWQYDPDNPDGEENAHNNNGNGVGEPANEEGQRSATVVDDAFLRSPFAFGKADLQTLRSEFDNFRIVTREPKENRHVQGQIDTIYSIQAGGATFTLYSTGEKQMLQSAGITSAGVELKRNIRINMPIEEFKTKFRGLADQSFTPDATITVQNSVVPQNMKFSFRNGSLREITYTGYVD